MQQHNYHQFNWIDFQKVRAFEKLSIILHALSLFTCWRPRGRDKNTKKRNNHKFHHYHFSLVSILYATNLHSSTDRNAYSHFDQWVSNRLVHACMETHIPAAHLIVHRKTQLNVRSFVYRIIKIVVRCSF